MLIARTKNWIVEKGTEGDTLYVINLKGPARCFMYMYHSKYKEISGDELPKDAPLKVSKAVEEWCQHMAKKYSAKIEIKDAGV